MHQTHRFCHALYLCLISDSSVQVIQSPGRFLHESADSVSCFCCLSLDLFSLSELESTACIDQVHHGAGEGREVTFPGLLPAEGGGWHAHFNSLQKAHTHRSLPPLYITPSSPRQEGGSEEPL